MKSENERDKIAEAITKSGCDSCTLCVECFPAEALSGTLWEAGMARSKLLDEQKYIGE